MGQEKKGEDKPEMYTAPFVHFERSNFAAHLGGTRRRRCPYGIASFPFLDLPGN